MRTPRQSRGVSVIPRWTEIEAVKETEADRLRRFLMLMFKHASEDVKDRATAEFHEKRP